MKLMQWLRSIHGWLGILILPWVIALGLTGFYLNHGNMVMALIGSGELDFSTFELLPGDEMVPEQTAVALAAAYWPGKNMGSPEIVDYHGESAYSFKDRDDELIVLVSSGYYFWKTAYTRKAYKPDGTRLETKIYWPRVFKEFHVRGWLGRTFGTVLADIAAISMVVFGLSGMYLFLWPRYRRFINRWRRPSQGAA
jgi:hypothetical protein